MLFRSIDHHEGHEAHEGRTVRQELAADQLSVFVFFVSFAVNPTRVRWR